MISPDAVLHLPDEALGVGFAVIEDGNGCSFGAPGSHCEEEFRGGLHIEKEGPFLGKETGNVRVLDG